MSDNCITQLGKDKVLSITPFSESSTVLYELKWVKEFTSSFNSDSPVPNHGFDSITKELHLLAIENSSLQVCGFRRILSVTQRIQALLVFFKKYKEFYIGLHSFSEKIKYTSLLSEEINLKIDLYGHLKDDASETLSAIRSKLKVIKGKINSSFSKTLIHYAQKEYLDDIKETIVDNRRVLAVKAMYRKKIRGTVLGSSKTGSLIYMEPMETLDYANEFSNLVFEEQEEIKKILKELTEFIRPYKSLLKKYQEYLTNIDAIHAKAKYAVTINGVLPMITTERRLNLIHAFHPLLLVANNKLKKNISTNHLAPFGKQDYCHFRPKCRWKEYHS